MESKTEDVQSLSSQLVDARCRPDLDVLEKDEPTPETGMSVGGSWRCSEAPNISSRPLIGSEGAEPRNKDTWDKFVNLCLLLICPGDITAGTKGKTARVKTTGLNAVWTHFLFVTPASVDWRVGMLYSLTEWWQTVKKCNQNNVYLWACHRVWVSKEFYWCHMQIRFRCRLLNEDQNLIFVEMDWDWCWYESEGKPPHDFTSRQVDETTAADWAVTSWGEAAAPTQTILRFSMRSLDVNVWNKIKTGLSETPVFKRLMIFFVTSHNKSRGSCQRWIFKAVFFCAIFPFIKKSCRSLNQN